MALTSAQQALLLFKKWLGLGQTTSSREFFNETAYPGRVAVYTNQIWTQADQIPNTAPVLSSGQTSGVVQYWQNSPLGAVPGTTNAFTSSLLINAIPFNYGDGTSYNYSVRDSIGGTIAFGQGDWIVDTDAGLLTFYSTVPSNMPPTISFYKYVGVKGFTSESVALTGSLLGTSSVAISSSYVEYANVGNKPTLISSSTQVNYTLIQNQPTTIPTASYVLNAVSSSFAATASYVSGAASNWDSIANKPNGLVSSSTQINTGSFSGSFTGVLTGTGSWAISSSFATTASYVPPSFIDNFVTVGLVGSNTNFNSIKAAVNSITDASAANTYTVRVYPGVYIEDTIVLKSYIAIKGDSSISTIVSASNPSASIFVMADQSMVIDMQIQGSTATTASAVVYSSPTTPQTNAIAYVENVRFGTNYTNAKVIGSGSSGNCILQCSNVKYGGFTESNKSFDVGFYVTSGSSGGIGRMQLRNVTSTNGGVAGPSQDQIFALADAPGCTIIVNGCLLTRAAGAATGTGFKVYNGGQLRLTAVNFQRWTTGIWAPQTGSAPSIDAIALNFENCTTDVLVQHTGSLGKVSGTDTFLKTSIVKEAPLYEVNKDPRRITVGKKGADFTSISASVAYVTDSSAANRYVIDVGPGQFTEKTIDLTGKPYVSIVGSNIQTTQIFASSSTQHIVKLGVNNEISFLTLANAGSGYAAIYVDDVGDFAQAHKISIYDSDIGIKVVSRTQDTQFYGEYIDINGTFSYGAYVSASNNTLCSTTLENYYLFPSGCAAIGNYVTHPSASLSLHTATLQGDNTTNGVAIQLESGAILEGSGLDIQDWDYGVKIPNTGIGPDFRMVGTMIHGSSTYDIENLNATTRGRFQGVSDHSKINNNSVDLYWNFLDDTDGENDVTRKLSVTFADGTHTDATTLIFKGSPMGVMQGGVITTGSGFNITVASGFGYVQDAIDNTIFKRIDWINGNLTLTANSNNYIYLTSAEVLTAAGSLPNNETNIILGRVVTNNTTIELIDQTPYNGEHMSNKLSTFNREALGPVYAAGSTVTEDSTPFKLDVTAGTYFFSENKFTPVGTSSINLTQYYPSASTWARYTSSVVPSKQYASSSALVAMSSSHYTKHTLYGVGEGVDEKYFLVINSNQYSTLVAAENANLPNIPTYFNDGVVPLAAVYVQSGSANITQIQDIRPTIGFRAAGVNASSVHGNLLGLSADDHTQYLLVNGTRAMAGNLALGGNNITNVGTMFGTASWANNSVSAITASAATSITFIPSTASFATSASFAPTILPIGIVSSSVQINTGSFTGSFTGTFIGTSSWATRATSASFATTSSAATSITFIPTTASFATTSSFSISASFAPTILPTGIVSSSVQINTGSFTGSFTGTLAGTSSWASNAISSSFATTASAATSITFTPATASFATTSSAATSITFVPSTASFAATASFVNILNQTVSASGNIEAGTNLRSNFSSGDEGGEINLARPQTNTSISGSIVIDVNANRLRIFEANSPNRGGYWDITSLAGGVGTNLVGGSGTVSSITAGNGLTGGTITATGTITVDTGSTHFTQGVAKVLVTSASFATTSSFATSASYAPTILPSGLVSSSTQINTGSFTGSFIGTLFGTSSWASNTISASYALSSSYAPTILPAGTVSSSTQINYNSIQNQPTTIPTASYVLNAVSSSFATTSSFATSASYAPITLPNGLVSSSTQINTGSFTGSFIGVFTGSVFGTSSVATSASFATSASYAPGGTASFPYIGAAVISGSLTVTGSTGINVTGPVTITGALQAQTKSFKIDHQILLGKKLIYGVLEGPEHGVYVRGRLTRNTIIHLPEEWKWLVDPISITVQLTPIGTQQVLYVQNIENNTIIINSNTPIDCFYFVQATRKDVAPLATVE